MPSPSLSISLDERATDIAAAEKAYPNDACTISGGLHFVRHLHTVANLRLQPEEVLDPSHGGSPPAPSPLRTKTTAGRGSRL